VPAFAEQLLVGIVIAAASSWITVRLSLGRFRSERWWESKQSAYEHVIEALHHRKASMNAALREVYFGRSVGEGTRELLRERSREGSLEIEKAANVGAFLLAEEAQDAVQQYQRYIETADYDPNWVAALENDLERLDACLSKVIAIAKKDLMPGKW